MRHVPKKLTDCPENLRESIDWLIQVRHGNGKPDEGLTKLSQALKKLIEEAISNATKSLETEKKKLSCPFKYSDKETYCQYYDSRIKKCQEASKDDETKKSIFQTTIDICTKSKEACIKAHKKHPPSAALKSVEEKIVQLGQLAGQLGSFIGESDKVTDAINKAKECLQERFKKCKSCLNQLHNNSHDCQDASNCQSIKQKIEKLQSQKSSINGKQNTPNDLLNNLCTGLEKFLGFNPSSKGYDGTGIVYSDLDRLCDGVMGFLSGVLSNIKEHLGQHKDTLNEAIDALNKNKHRGKNGFNIAIGQVVAGVRGYNDAVKDSNKKVSEPMTLILSQVNDKFKQDVKAILPEKDQDNAGRVEEAKVKVDETMEQCKNFAKAFNDAFNFENNKNSEMKQNVNDLNSKLHDSVLVATKAVKHESERLEQLAKKEREDYEAVTKFITTKLVGLKECVQTEINLRVQQLMKDLKPKVQKIRDKLDEIRVKLTGIYMDLDTWIASALDVIKLTEDKVQEMLAEVSDQSTFNGRAQVAQAAENIRTRLGGEVQELDKWNKEATDAVKRGIENCEKILERVQNDHAKNAQHNGGKTVIKKKADELKTNAVALRTAAESAMTRVKAKVTEALKTVVSMNDELKQDLNDVKKKVNEAVEAVKTEIGKLHDVIEKGQVEGAGTTASKKIAALIKKILDKVDPIKIKVGEATGSGKENESSIYHNWTQLKSAVKIQIDKLSNDVYGGENGLLDEIESGLGNYAMKFKRRFKQAIEQMVQKMINDKEGAVAAYLGSYAGSGKLEYAKEKIVQEVKKLDYMPDVSPTGEPSDDVGYVRNFMKGYMQVVVKKLTSIQGMATEIDGDEKLKIAELQSNRKNHLKLALKSIFSTVNSVVERVNEELEFFTKADAVGDSNYDLGRNVDGIISAVENIKKQFDNTVLGHDGGHSDKIDKTLKTVMSNIKDLHGNLSAALSDSSSVPEVNHAASVDTAIEKVKSCINSHLETDRGPARGGGADKVKLVNLSRYKVYIKQDSPLPETPIGTEGELLKAIKETETLGLSDLEAKIGDSAKNDKITDKTFVDPVTVIDAQLHYLTQLVDKATEDSYNNKGVKTLLNTLQTGLANGQLGTANGLQTIHASIKLLHEELPTVLDKLTFLSVNISNSGESAKAALKTLKETNIKEKLLNLRGELHNLQTVNLTAAIDLADKFRREADNASRQILANLRQHVDDQVGNVTKQLTAELGKNYVISMKDLMTKFADAVTKELQPLPKEITDDLEHGHKKFMKTFGNVFVAGISSVKEVKSDISANVVQQDAPQKYPLGKATEILRNAFTNLFNNLKSQPDFKADYTKMRLINAALAKMLEGLKNAAHFNYEFCGNVDSFGNQVGTFNPTKFGDGMNPAILEALKKGFSDLAGELSRAYISRYSEKRIKWQTIEDEEQERYAKITLTVIPILYAFLSELKYGLEYEKWNDKKIYNGSNPTSSLHVLFFSDNGYDENLRENARHGELNHRDTFNGSHILEHLNNQTHKLFTLIPSLTAGIAISKFNLDGPHIAVEEENGVISKFHNYLKTYFAVRHIVVLSPPRSPCSIYEICVWLSGLPYNPVYGQLKKQMASSFEVQDKQNPSRKTIEPVDAYPQSFTHDQVTRALDDATSEAYSLLTGILGHGDATTIYACDFPANALNLLYPSSGANCLDMLLDILRRLFPALRFLQTQCSVGAKHNGWEQCQYGKAVSSSNWLCKDHSSDEAACQPKCQPTCQANSKVKCQPTSPLMSYLNDCLPGHLPHQLTSIGCKYECKTCPGSKRGMPCLTPLGFRGFSGSTKTGKELCEMIQRFFNIQDLTSLLSLSPKAPSTLPEHFSFTLSLVKCLDVSEQMKSGAVIAVREAFTTSITKQSVKLYTEVGDLTKALRMAYGPPSSNHGECQHSHVRNLTTASSCKEKSNADIECAPYLSTMCHDAYSYFAAKHTDVYLSWSIYLPWDFWNQLKHLYDSFCNINCADWGCRQCLQGTACKSGKHGQSETNGEKTRKSYCQCTSIVTCKGVSPTLYQYGLSFQDASSLNHETYPNTCTDFCSQLDKVLKSNYFVKLFAECDNFIWTIREPFSYLVLALWSLSLFYLLCVMVGRLDVLHIKSHLRIPSSHRITAQSLLAAAQVGRLAKISYLQP